ncbi:MAG: 50S ribosomal protein L3, partial [Candidatus Paceibacterota bacterium]
MKFILGTKKNMSQVFDASGIAYPATIIVAGPVTVTQVKDAEKDGYVAVQVGFGTMKAEKMSKPQKGHLKDIGAFPILKEFRLPKEQVSALKIGDKIDLTSFAIGDMVEVSSISKGKGFQGVVKRHGFKGLPRTHGQKHSE